MPRITTRDVLAVMIVGATLVFNAISLSTGKPLDPTSIGFTGMVVGYYFRDGSAAVREAVERDPLPEPYTGQETND